MMILLVSGATRTVEQLVGHPNLGVLLTPRGANNPPPEGITWAADNSAFNGFDDALFRSMLGKIRNRPDCQWVAAPDVVGNHQATLDLWPKYIKLLIEHGLSGAFVAQDGCTVESLPWGRGMRAVFIGGTTRFKLGSEAARIVHEANRRGMWTHMGRVNTLRRLFYASSIGIRSVDGSKFSQWSETYLPSTLAFLAQLDQQHMIQFEDGWGSPEPTWCSGSKRITLPRLDVTPVAQAPAHNGAGGLAGNSEAQPEEPESLERLLGPVGRTSEREG